jgi:acetyl-CoA C-acetyltransferase
MTTAYAGTAGTSTDVNVIVAGARTPIGRLGGGLADHTAADLGAVAIAEALRRAGVEGREVETVIMGQVVQAGAGPNPARMAAVDAGIPMSVPGMTVNKLCLSGLSAIILADRLVASGLHRIVVAGGMESMTRAPYVAVTERDSRRTPVQGLRDALETDALVCGFDQVHVGAATERYQRPLGITRADQDEYAARSHARATEAIEKGRFDDELTEVSGTDLAADEGVRPSATVQKLGQLRPAFAEDGTITAGSASQISDGGCAVVVMSRAEAERRGLEWIAEIGAPGSVAGPDPSLLSQPAAAVRDALARDGRRTLDDLDVVEVNEAFAGVAIQSARELHLDVDQLNVNGGAIALGHPVGMSGARLTLTLALELRRRGGGTGVAALCGGGGQGEALLLHAPR